MKTISRVADEYGLSAEQVRELLMRAADQEVVPGTPPPPSGPTEEELQEVLEGETVKIYGVEYSLEPGTVTQEQLALINGLKEVKSEQAINAYNTMLEGYAVENESQLSAAQAQYLISAMQSASSDPAWNWKFNTFLQSIDPLVWILGLGIGVPTASKYIAPKFIAYLQGRAAAKAAEKIGEAGARWGAEIAAKQAAARLAVEAGEEFVEQATREAAEAAAVAASQRAAGAAAGRVGSTAASTASGRLAAQAATTTGQQAASRTAGQVALTGAAKVLPYVAQGATAFGALSTAALPFQLAYMYLQPEVERYTSQFGWRMDPTSRARTITPWGGFQGGGGGAFFGGAGGNLNIPGMTDPWREW